MNTMDFIEQERNRESIVKRIHVSASVTVDIVKTDHFLERLHIRNFDFSDVLALAEKAVEKALKNWYDRKFRHTQGVIKQDELNVMFGIHYNKNTKHIDLELVSAMEKRHFITDNIPDVVVINL